MLCSDWLQGRYEVIIPQAVYFPELFLSSVHTTFVLGLITGKWLSERMFEHTRLTK